MQLLPKPARTHRLLKLPKPAPDKAPLPAALPTPIEPSPLSGAGDRGVVAVFIDGSSLFHAASYLGIEVDYTRLLHRLGQGGRLLRAYFYTGTDPSNDRQQGFLLWMRRNGYRVVAKELTPAADGSKRVNLSIEIVVDMMRLAAHCDTLVLLSGDGNLTYAVNALTYQGARVELVNLRAMTSESLINVADHYSDLEALKQEIQKQPH